MVKEIVPKDSGFPLISLSFEISYRYSGISSEVYVSWASASSKSVNVSEVKTNSKS
jgi:hypothetical protein